MHMSTHVFRSGTVALVSVTALAAGATLAEMAAPAGATTPASLSGVQAKAAAAITLRVNDLNAAIAKVNGDSGLGSAAPTLAAYLQADIPGLQALGQKIAADPTVAVAVSDAKTIFTNYRVLALVLPAARLAGASDQIENGSIPRLNADAAKAATYETPANQATIGPLVSDLNAQISAAGPAVSGISATILAYTPAQWNANQSLLSASRSAVQGAAGDIKKAFTDVQQIRADLKAQHSAAPATPSTSTTPSTPAAPTTPSTS
jgi:hypothetical protein